MKNTRKLFIFSILSLFCLINLAQAQVIVPIRLNGEQTSYTLPAGDQSNSITFWGKSDGKVTMPYGLAAVGPSGAKVEVFAGLVTRGKPATPENVRVWNRLAIRVGDSTRSSLTIAQAGTASATTTPYQTPYQTSAVNVCELIDLNEICPLIIPYLNGLPCTRENVCNFINGGGPIPTPTPVGTPGGTPLPGGNYGQVSGSGLLQKDTCDSAAKTYLLKIVIDFSAVNRALYPEGIQVITAARVYPYGGSKAATIKPVSDGKYAPHPLLLMASVGGYGFGGEKINLVQWTKGKIRSKRAVGIKPGMVYYRGLVLTRSVIGGLLRGGKGVFEISNGSNAYGVCFSLTRTRQRANGYRN